MPAEVANVRSQRSGIPIARWKPVGSPVVSTWSSITCVHRVVPRMLQAWPGSTAPHPMAVDATSNGAMITGSPSGSPVASAARAPSAPVRPSIRRTSGSNGRAHSRS